MTLGRISTNMMWSGALMAKLRCRDIVELAFGQHAARTVRAMIGAKREADDEDAPSLGGTERDQGEQRHDHGGERQQGIDDAAEDLVDRCRGNSP